MNKWLEIPQDLYFAIYNHCQEHEVFAVFGSCTNLTNTSAWDAKVSTEWGFKNADNPLIKSVAQPESQIDIPENLSEWPHKYYIYTDNNINAFN